MTTVCWDGRTLASDSQIQEDDAIEPGGLRKIYKIGNVLAGFAGNVENGMEFILWLKAGADPANKPTKFDRDFKALVIRPSGRAYGYEGRLVPCRCGKITAIGTGRTAALAAMMAGASAEQAVRIAIQLDPNSGGRVRVLDLAT